MNLRLPLFLGALGVLTASAGAQTTPATPLPDGPVLVPIVPTPLDNQVPDSNKPRAFAVRLRYVKPSVMASWLEPKNHEAPSPVPGETVRPSPLRAFSLPEGIVSIVAVDPQNTLLIFGTPEGVARLQQVITFLDRPQSTTFVLPQQSGFLSFEAKIYWLDSLAPEVETLGRAALSPRVAFQSELDSLEELQLRDRASLLALTVPSISTNQGPIKIRFAPVDADAQISPRDAPFLPNGPRSDRFNYQMPHFRANPDIDPGIQMNRLRDSLRLQPGELQLTPLSSVNGGLVVMRIQTESVLSTYVSIPQGQSLMWSGSARALGLKSPSPRFDAFVVKITPRAVPLLVFPTPVPFP